MKTVSFVKSSTPSALNDSVDTDVTPMMNVFIILLPFLVSMAVLTRLAIIEFSVPPNITNASLDKSQGKPQLKLTVVVNQRFLALTLGDKMLDSIPVKADSSDLGILSSALAARRDSLSNRDDIVVAAGDRIQCERIVQVMDRCGAAGFSNVGLASSADQEARGP